MNFDEWAYDYALGDEPLTLSGRIADCKAAWVAATNAAREACAIHVVKNGHMFSTPAACASLADEVRSKV